MTNYQMANPQTGLSESPCEMRWMTVQDDHGSYHLEARWIDPASVPVAGAVHAA